MVEITIIIPEIIEDTLEDTIKNILNQSFMDFELILLNNKKINNLQKLASKYSRNDNHVKITDNIESLISESQGKYILFLDSLNKVKKKGIISLHEKISEKNLDLLMLNNDDKNSQNIKHISRITGNKQFSYEKIIDDLFEMKINSYNLLYNKKFLMKNKLSFKEDLELIAYKSILKAKKILLHNESIYLTHYEKNIQKNSTYFKNYIETQSDIEELFKDNEYYQLAFNSKISKIINEFNQILFKSKKQAYQLLRNECIEILNRFEDEQAVHIFTKENRKLFEQVIISESVEEYDLLKKVYEDKNSINYMKRYEEILKSEQRKIKNFNNSLVSSNSWRLTKIFRL